MTKKKNLRARNTVEEAFKYGFRWGPLDVIRATIFRDYYALTITTDTTELRIWVSPKGRSVRVWKNGRELL